ncbi:SDR family oxidoreductase [Rhodococcus sp. IEGM 1354]|uniref:SDR family oxidoreductase n=1 Tax=Rhodococcus sp. IEGM 1354 TaxID=3047088 RepID=UPI0024B769BE|nr:SDR family oxidoreductase [Rhodococcus sp. IEGM 1354]MDI9933652.1 SDR family oxidoreductase [Rhodococcus sp. IEGM 1354]
MLTTAMITGAAGGLGTALAEALAPTHRLFLMGRPSSRLDEVTTRFGATALPVDLVDTEQLSAAVHSIDRLNVLVHNAGVAFPARVAESSAAEWRNTMEVNVIGAVALTLALLPALRAAEGHVVFVNSGSGINVSPGLASYSASKFALRGFAESLRNDEPSLRVTSIYPGRIATVMQEGLIAYAGDKYDPSLYLSPETVANMVANAVNAPSDADIRDVVVRAR